jgi:heme a synthase
MNDANPHRARYWHAVLTLAATWGLICLGGLVTSHGAGMAVPDWPNTYGYNMFFFPVSQWVGGIFYEHTHRLLGSLVGLLTLVLTLWLQGRAARPWLRWGGGLLLTAGLLWAALASGRKDWALLAAATGAVALAVSRVWPAGAPASPWLRRLGVLALVGVVFQGVLGGLRVVLLQDAIGVIHATLAQLFLLLVAVIALLSSPWWSRMACGDPLSRVRSEPIRGLILLATVMILGQLILGAAMRHRHAGLAVPDFPLAHGQLWPATDPGSIARYNQQRDEVRAVHPLTAVDVQLHMAHRLAGFWVVGFLGFVAWRTRRLLGPGHPLVRGVVVWAVLGGVQLLLGALTVWTGKSADIATAHVAVGSLLLAGGGVLSVVASRYCSAWAENPANAGQTDPQNGLALPHPPRHLAT